MGRKKKSSVTTSGALCAENHPSAPIGFILDIPGLKEADEEITQLQNLIDEAQNKKKNITDSYLLRIERIIGHAAMEEIKNNGFDMGTVHQWVISHTKSVKDLKFYKKAFELLKDENPESHTENTGG